MISNKSCRHLLFILPVLFLISYIIGCGQNPTGGHHHAGVPSWHLETIDATGYPPCALALDSGGAPHVCYLGYLSSTTLAYAAFDGASWQKLAVTSESTSFDLALDGSGVPNVCYKAGNALKRATLEGSSWITDVVDATGYPNSISLAINPTTGRVHVVYGRTNSPALMYATKEAGSAWIRTTIESATCEYASIVLDSGGNPHVSYNGTNGIKYATFSGSWTITTVTTETGIYTSIAVDGSGDPNISYQDTANFILRYAKRIGTTWEIETADGNGTAGKNSSITLDPGGGPHICYVSDSVYIRHAWWNGISWEAETVALGDSVSSQMGSSGKPKIAYVDNGALKFAEYY